MPDRFDDDRESDDRRTAALMGLAIVLSLAIAGIVLIRDLGKEAKLEDCLMSGRTNCAPIELPHNRFQYGVRRFARSREAAAMDSNRQNL